MDEVRPETIVATAVLLFTMGMVAAMLWRWYVDTKTQRILVETRVLEILDHGQTLTHWQILHRAHEFKGTEVEAALKRLVRRKALFMQGQRVVGAFVPTIGVAYSREPRKRYHRRKRQVGEPSA